MVVSCLPDTGCSQTLISISLARQLQCKVKPDTSVRLFTADGNQMSVAGLADLSITNNNNKNLVQIKTRVIVTRQPAHPALISWHDMVRLNIIHDSFPVTALHTTSSVDHLRSSVIKANPNVFRDSITSTPMSGGEVHIHLLPDAIPFRISVARQIPLRFTAPAEDAIKN